MSRFARNRRVFFFEEPVFEKDVQPYLRTLACPETGVRVQTPVLPPGLTPQQVVDYQRTFLHSMLEQNSITNHIAWYYTPMALEFASALRSGLTIYDCMDELSAFAGAPPAMRSKEAALFAEADLVFTGGASLFQSKRKQHGSVHLFPSSVDVAHFSRARSIECDPDDQARIPRPRLGYAGVVDERMDLELLRQVAAERSHCHFVLLGPIVKIDPAMLPRSENIHYLGMKQYAALPGYLAGWDIGMLPFALNDSTRFISPTKTPEYLAAGLPVVSTPIHDVINPYGDLGLVQIVNGPGDFLRTVDSLLASPPNVGFRARVDNFLSQSSWDKTWTDMNKIMEKQFALKHLPLESRPALGVLGSVAAKGASNA